MGIALTEHPLADCLMAPEPVLSRDSLSLPAGSCPVRGQSLLRSVGHM